MQQIEKIQNMTKHLDRTLEVFSALCLIISVGLAFVGVILRYQFGVSYQLLEEICRYAIVYGVFLYIGPLIKKNEHIKMSFLEEKLTDKNKHILNVVIGIILFISFLILLYAAAVWALSIFQMQLNTLSGEMLMIIPAFSIVLGMFFGCIYAFLQIIVDFYYTKQKGGEQ